MTFEDRYLVFLDVLGWSEAVQQAANDDVLRRRIGRAVAAIKSLAETPGFGIGAGNGHWASPRYSYFSDTLIASYSLDAGNWVESAVVSLCISFARKLLEHGFFVRGAVHRGLLSHERPVIVGPALIEAYRLESQVAIYPRILVSPDCRGLIRTMDGLNRTLTPGDAPPSRLMLCKDGFEIIDYLGWHPLEPGGEEYPRRMHQAASLIAEATGQNRKVRNTVLLDKYLWLADYYERVRERGAEVAPELSAAVQPLRDFHRRVE